ncbi:hypothetical protein [Paraburkholderia unamae]|uniref:hypothetical protein n=1 Tax=Paraburkholderia unamae TaxID=219649 RepID=UPI001057D224|nr:hypothetical protein [Paraburkholderia unamae]
MHTKRGPDAHLACPGHAAIDRADTIDIVSGFYRIGIRIAVPNKYQYKKSFDIADVFALTGASVTPENSSR